ncbi:hypothetical protein EPR50_G00001080 [Perca flavescens]|uniref:Uncharacterized protein n=1 Tax=Perca flavescens TaxID=8167 RepID=A0A484DN33_PERFV|nr:hypothetical protein EPR50_G00001080 [Perca flavescens]
MPVNPTVMTRLQELKEVDYRAGRATAGSRKVRSGGLSQRRQAGREAQEPRSPSTGTPPARPQHSTATLELTDGHSCHPGLLSCSVAPESFRVSFHQRHPQRIRSLTGFSLLNTGN